MPSLKILADAGFDTAGALARLGNNEAFYFRLLTKFLGDPTYGKLVSSIEAGDTKAGGEAAHALKGVSATLGMDDLSVACATLQNIYMDRETGDPGPVYQAAKAAYAKDRAAIEAALA
ncbi:MAG: Hpt domain-containing protein [Oscillospiraceae bacterium]|nr:Hpt domain-containing protein [Oscillospiraceae bacterium]